LQEFNSRDVIIRMFFEEDDKNTFWAFFWAKELNWKKVMRMTYSNCTLTFCWEGGPQLKNQWNKTVHWTINRVCFFLSLFKTIMLGHVQVYTNSRVCVRVFAQVLKLWEGTVASSPRALLIVYCCSELKLVSFQSVIVICPYLNVGILFG